MSYTDANCDIDVSRFIFPHRHISQFDRKETPVAVFVLFIKRQLNLSLQLQILPPIINQFSFDSLISQIM